MEQKQNVCCVKNKSPMSDIYTCNTSKSCFKKKVRIFFLSNTHTHKNPAIFYKRTEYEVPGWDSRALGQNLILTFRLCLRVRPCLEKP